jgi:hypothetical protein
MICTKLTRRSKSFPSFGWNTPKKTGKNSTECACFLMIEIWCKNAFWGACDYWGWRWIGSMKTTQIQPPLWSLPNVSFHHSHINYFVCTPFSPHLTSPHLTSPPIVVAFCIQWRSSSFKIKIEVHRSSSFSFLFCSSFFFIYWNLLTNSTNKVSRIHSLQKWID